MNKVSKRLWHFADHFGIAILPLAILFLTYFVLAKETEMFQQNTYENTNQGETIDISEYDLTSKVYFSNSGIASYYGRKFHNRRTSSGEKYNMYNFTAAHRTLPFGTIVRITNLSNDKVILARINDRGPFIKKRIIDLSYQTAKSIEGLGLPEVKIEALLHRNDEEYPIDTTDSYFFGYSYDKPLICIPKPFLEIIDSTNQFQIALTTYNFHKLYYTENEIYIFVPVEYSFSRENRNSPTRYYIASIRNNNKIAPLEDIALLSLK